jgi:hypothetical protein
VTPSLTKGQEERRASFQAEEGKELAKKEKSEKRQTPQGQGEVAPWVQKSKERKLQLVTSLALLK